MNCPICMEVFKGHIYMCKEGHAVCQGCHSQLGAFAKCPTCRGQFDRPPRRNRPLEEVIAELKVTECKHHSWGCSFKGNERLLATHEPGCKFGKVVCLLCSEEVDRNSAEEHMQRELDEYLGEVMAGGHAISNGGISKETGSERGSLCSLCRVRITKGMRFQCFRCPDVNICCRCERRGEHSKHQMIRMKWDATCNPMQQFLVRN